MSPSLDRPRTGKSISVAFAFAFALRACVRAKLRERDNAFQWLGLILCDFPGLRSTPPSGPAGPRSSCPFWPRWLDLPGLVWACLGLSGPAWACLGLPGPVWASPEPGASQSWLELSYHPDVPGSVAIV